MIQMNGHDFLQSIKSMSRDPYSSVKKYSLEGREVIGYMCSYVPEEIIYAAGLLPVRLLGRTSVISGVDKHLQTYCCSHVRFFLEDYISGKYKDLKGIFFAHTCDTMQSFYDIFRVNNPSLFVFNFNFPSRIDGNLPFEYAMAEMKRFEYAVESFSGRKISSESLEDAIQIYNKNRELLGRLYRLHSQNPDLFPSVALYHTATASMFMDKKEINPMLQEFLSNAAASGLNSGKRKGLLLVGSININEEIYNIIDECGAFVADDDLCTGHRYFDGLVSGFSEEAVLKRYFQKAHCPAKHLTNTSRGERILRLAKDSRAAGVLFIHLKFCDPHAFDYPYIKELLDKARIPSHMIEIEQTNIQSGQFRTRIQGFVETL
jgi:bcr-type benzoyl-CoA reductase subunit C